jgi:predicted HAD superfamily Cof-like phosphohydrolase
VNTFDKVHALHLAFGHPVRDTPTLGSEADRKLRVKLIVEEALEFANAAGYFVMAAVCNSEQQFEVVKLREPDLVEMADGLGDLDVVVNGGFHVFGLDPVAIGDEIQRSNMSKLGEDGKPIKTPEGRFVKGPNYQRPNLKAVIYGPAGSGEG